MARKRVRRADPVPAPIRVDPSQSFDSAYGQWSTFTIGVGTPSQNFRVLPASRASEAIVTSNRGCIASDPANCYQLRGGESFNGNPPAGFQSNASSTWNSLGLYSLEAENYINMTGSGEFGTDVLSLNGGNGSSTGDGRSLAQQIVGAVPDKSFLLGELGLSDRPSEFSSAANTKMSILDNLYKNKLIPSKSYGYTAGAYYGNSSTQTYGSLTLGGFDSTRINGNRAISLQFSQSDAKQLMVGVQSIIVSDSLKGTASMTAGTNGHMSLIDSAVPEIWLPIGIAENIAASFGLFYDTNTGYYLINSTMHDRWTSSNPLFTFQLGATATENGNSVNIVLPYKAFEHQLGWPVYSPATYYFPMKRAANDTQYVLGRAILQQTYLTVDYDRKNFTLGPAVFPNTGVNPRIVTITSPKTNSKSGGISAGAIAGIVIGAIAVAILAIAAFLFFRRRRKTRNTTQDAKIAELEAKHTSYDSAYHKIDQDILLEAGGDEVVELPGIVTTHDEKHGGGGTVELQDPRPPSAVYEMEGDSTPGSWHQDRSSGVDSPGISSPGSAPSPYSRMFPSPAQPSPLTPGFKQGPE